MQVCGGDGLVYQTTDELRTGRAVNKTYILRHFKLVDIKLGQRYVPCPTFLLEFEEFHLLVEFFGKLVQVCCGMVDDLEGGVELLHGGVGLLCRCRIFL